MVGGAAAAQLGAGESSGQGVSCCCSPCGTPVPRRAHAQIHTPDSSRYWLADSYEARHAAGQEPEMIDKEFLRLWFRQRCDPYKDAVLPEAPHELVCELSKR